jgi:serine/threonine protein kinase
VKPSNIMVTEGHIKLIDFGISTAMNSQLTSIKGTKGYMAPEQFLRGYVDEQTDIFSLGVTFNVIFGGRPLQQTFKDVAGQEKHVASGSANHDRSLVSPADEVKAVPMLEELIRRCTIPKRSERIQNMSDVIGKIVAIGYDQGIRLVEPA